MNKKKRERVTNKSDDRIRKPYTAKKLFKVSDTRHQPGRMPNTEQDASGPPPNSPYPTLPVVTYQVSWPAVPMHVLLNDSYALLRSSRFPLAVLLNCPCTGRIDFFFWIKIKSSFALMATIISI